VTPAVVTGPVRVAVPLLENVETLTVPLLAPAPFRVPPEATVRLPPVSDCPPVFRVELTVRVPPHESPRVLIVAVAVLNTTLLNSAKPPNWCVAAPVKVTVLVPTFHPNPLALSIHVPLTVQFPLPNWIAPPEMLAAVTVPVPVV